MFVTDGDNADSIDVNYTMTNPYTGTLCYTAPQQAAYLQQEPK